VRSREWFGSFKLQRITKYFTRVVAAAQKICDPRQLKHNQHVLVNVPFEFAGKLAGACTVAKARHVECLSAAHGGVDG
jgi:hypothetical protein